MPPAYLVTLVTFLLEMCTTSPVYNMQPAFITANIGTGRNIRNLPCISRKNNQKGVCMFAIDCLKANGTHLGTCIDRFYFGSCCHVEPVIHDIIENTIESNFDIIPPREPPLRLNSTIRPMTTTSKKTTTESTTQRVTTVTTPKSTSSSTSTSRGTTISESTSASSPSSHTTSSTTTTPRTYPPTTQKILEDTTSVGYKLTTFQSVDGSVFADTTTYRPTSTAKTSTARPTTRITTTRPTAKPTKSTQKPVRTTAKPQRTTTTPRRKPPGTATTTKRPSVITNKVTRRPAITTKPTKKVGTTTKPGSTTSRFTTAKPTVTTSKTTTPPSTTKLTTEPTRITSSSSTTRSTTPKATISTPKIPESTTQASIPSLTVKPSGTNISAVLPPSENNEIDTDKTTSGPSIITWAIVESEKNVSTTASPPPSSTSSSINTSTTLIAPVNSTSEDWVPLTTPDGWVLLPSVPPLTTAGDTQTDKPQEVVSSQTSNVSSPEAEQQFSISTSASTSISTTKGTTTTESVSKQPSITYIPLGTSSTSTGTSTATDGATIQSSTETLGQAVPSSTLVSTNGSTNVSTEKTPGGDGSPSSPTVVTISAPSATEGSIATTVSSLDITTTMGGTATPTPTVEVPSATSMVNMSDFTDVCGRRMYPEARIVGGEKSSFGKWPWQISLRQWRTSTYLHKCGAALLNENWAITAAHCVDKFRNFVSVFNNQHSESNQSQRISNRNGNTIFGQASMLIPIELMDIVGVKKVDTYNFQNTLVPPSDLLLRLGEHDLSTESEPYLHEERRVQIVASHPQFDPRTFEYDLALLRFYEPVTFQPNILPVCVPQSDENFVGRTAYVTGWGRLYEDGPLPSVLQEVSVPVINNTVCESMYRAAGYIEHIPHIFICAGWRRGGFDSCEGDSGGPMVIQREDKRFLLAGIISWGIGCAEPNQPGVYTRISEFRDWINQILQF